jgi:hypothetical protein
LIFILPTSHDDLERDEFNLERQKAAREKDKKEKMNMEAAGGRLKPADEYHEYV